MPTHTSDLTLGYRNGQPIVLTAKERLKHVHISGLTGAGKSRYLEHLIRQDLKAWPWTKRGMLVIDPHGEVVSGIMDWVSANKLTHLPIIPIDFRQKEQIVSYNVLRQRASEPSVIIDNFVKAMSYVWGQGGTDRTPLFERWASNLLYALYYSKRTLADAAHLFTPEGLIIADHIEDPMVRRDWLWARRNRKDFETATSSSVNRFRRFLLNPMLRATFGQTDRSLDLGKALTDGQIILVSLARKDGLISRENADLFATLVLADLWASADERGKSDRVKPFWIYIDEFQRFISPVMAENLAEARGFGLGMTLSNQFPLQILDGGPYGPRTYNEVMENTRTKVVFRLRTRANLLPVAESLFASTFDPYRVKYQHYSTKVLGHEVKYMQSRGSSSTQSVGAGEMKSRMVGRNRSKSDNWSHTDTAVHTLGTATSHTDSVTEGATIGISESLTDGSSDSDQWSKGESEGSAAGRTWSEGESESSGNNKNRSRSVSVSQDIGIPSDEMNRKLSRGGRRADYHALADHSDGFGKHQFQLEHAGPKVGLTETLSDGGGENASRSLSRSRGGSESESRQSSMSRGGGTSSSESVGLTLSEQLSYNESSSDTFTESESFATGTADAVGGSESFGTNEADTAGTSTQWSNAHGTSISSSPMLFPIIGKEADAPMFQSIDEQIFVAMTKIARLKDREAYVLTSDMDTPVFIQTPDVNRSDLSEVCTHACIGWYQVQSGLTLPLAVAFQKILDRDTEFTSIHSADAELCTPRRRIEALVKNRVQPARTS